MGELMNDSLEGYMGNTGKTYWGVDIDSNQ